MPEKVRPVFLGDVGEGGILAVVDAQPFFQSYQQLVCLMAVIERTCLVADETAHLAGHKVFVVGCHRVAGNSVQSRLGGHPYVASLVDGEIEDEVVRQTVFYSDIVVEDKSLGACDGVHQAGQA